MCDIRTWCIALPPCPVHRKHPLLGPLEPGHPTPMRAKSQKHPVSGKLISDPGCTKAEAEYLVQMCGEPPDDGEPV